MAIVLFARLQDTAPTGAPLPAAARIGGPFELTTQNGERFSSQSLAGKPYMLFFGFTHCPDICPTTLAEVSNHLADLGPSGDKVKVLFITVDPERDTAELLKTYMTAFDPRIVALTGTPAEIADIIRKYRAYAEKVPGKDGDYTMNHTATVYLFDSANALVSTLSFQEKPEVQREKVRRLVAR
jgi:protein SCO1/2